MKFLLLAALVISCGEDEVRREVPAPDYTKAPSADYAGGRGRKEAPAVRFVDITAAAGIDFVHENGARGDKWMPATMGSGCALFDHAGAGDRDHCLVGTGDFGTESAGVAPAEGALVTTGEKRSGLVDRK